MKNTIKLNGETYTPGRDNCGCDTLTDENGILFTYEKAGNIVVVMFSMDDPVRIWDIDNNRDTMTDFTGMTDDRDLGPDELAIIKYFKSL